MKIPAIVLLLALAVARMPAQNVETDLSFAVSQLVGNGPVPFARALYPVDDDSYRQLADRLTAITRDAGAAIGFEILSRRLIAQKVERIVIALYYEKRPVYLRVDSYSSPKGRIFLPALVSREAIDVIPLDVINTSGK